MLISDNCNNNKVSQTSGVICACIIRLKLCDQHKKFRIRNRKFHLVSGAWLAFAAQKKNTNSCIALNAFFQGRRQGATRPWGAEGILCDRSAPSNRESVGSEKAPSNDEESIRKLPPLTSVQCPPSMKWRPASSCPPPFRFSKYAAGFLVA